MAKVSVKCLNVPASGGFIPKPNTQIGFTSDPKDTPGILKCAFGSQRFVDNNKLGLF